MNHPDTSHEHAWVQQGQVPGVARPAGKKALTEYHDEELDSAFLELEIRSAGFYLNRAMDAGNKPAARKWEQEQRRLIGMRSPEQIARLEAAARQG